MPDLIMVCPSRGRPQAAWELAECFRDTRTGKSELMFAIDDNDPCRDEYAKVATRAYVSIIPDSTSMVFALNAAARLVMATTEPFAIGFLGDDHRPRTKGFDERYLEALREMGTGIVYSNDLFQGETLPTHCAMTTDIIDALGYMAPPLLTHLCIDNWWKMLGEQAGCLRYLPDVLVEHMHPLAGKAEWDEGHTRVNAPGMYRVDRSVFDRLVRTELPSAVEAVVKLRG